MRQVASINWRYIGDAIPAFVTVMFIPFSYSAAYGLIAGLMTYTTLNLMAYMTELISCGRFVPDDADAREYWSSKSSVLIMTHLTLTSSLSPTGWPRPLVCQGWTRHCGPIQWRSQERRLFYQEWHLFLAPRKDWL